MRLSISRDATETALRGSLRAICLLCAACANTAADPEAKPSQLDRLRILAISADPPDLAAGESTTLRSLVFEPNERAVEYAWSWCPVPVDARSACPVEEALWAELWASSGLSGAPPPYDLGSGPSAVLRLGFDAESLERLCDEISTLGPAAEPARAVCLDEIGATVVLRARTEGDEEVATKHVPLLREGTPPAARNQNPGPLGPVSVSVVGSGEPPVATAALLTGRKYLLRLDLSESQSEMLPPTEMAPGLGVDGGIGTTEATPINERETLVLSWFVTPGEVADPAGEDEDFGPFGDGTQRTVYAPGQSVFDSFLENGWKVPASDRSEAELVLVLRDGRVWLARHSLGRRAS
jgi:hypothetical protein